MFFAQPEPYRFGQLDAYPVNSIGTMVSGCSNLVGKLSSNFNLNSLNKCTDFSNSASYYSHDGTIVS